MDNVSAMYTLKDLIEVMISDFIPLISLVSLMLPVLILFILMRFILDVFYGLGDYYGFNNPKPEPKIIKPSFDQFVKDRYLNFFRFNRDREQELENYYKK